MFAEVLDRVLRDAHVAFDEWREAVAMSVSGKARGKLVILTGS